MASKGTLVLGNKDSFDINFYGDQTWTFWLRPSTGQVLSDANIKMTI